MTNEYDAGAAFFRAAIGEFAHARPPAEVRVVDFGTGSGRLVDSLRSLGFDAWGCDIGPYWLSRPTDNANRLSTITLSPYRLPYDDDSTDVVLSTSVLEHAQNKEEVFREVHRILKPGGYSMHLFPGKWYLPVEPHIHVPLVNMLWPYCPRWWLDLWARMGVRNEYQKGKPWREVADLNAQYVESRLSYWTTQAYRELSVKVFGNFAAPMDVYLAHAQGRIPRLLRHLPFGGSMARLAGELRMCFVVQQKL